MIQNTTIKYWAEDDRPREKLKLKGKHNLSDSELLAILLSTGTKEKSALELAKELLNSVSSNLNEFARLSFSDLTKFKGIGEAKAITILAALEIGRRRKEIVDNKKIKFTSAPQVYNFLKPIFQDLVHEEFHIVLLNRANGLICTEFISSGGYAGTVVDGKMVFKKAIDKNAHAIILCHNHPSGQLMPSEEDLKITKNLSKFSKLIDISILDHLIFTDNGYFSFSESGIMI
ncbi:MAG: DNA repair protein RadC [Flavobacteriia bacterium]|nr:DNA repair protein RadC [Flavobacteriia bacterium]